MKHVTVVGLAADRESVLQSLQNEGVVHLTPCAPDSANHDSAADLKKKLDQLRSCMTMLDEFRHKRYELEFTDDELPGVLCELLDEWKRLHDELFAVRHQIAEYTPWGDFVPSDLDRLKSTIDVYVQLWSVPKKDYELLEFADGVYHKPLDQHADMRFCTVSYGKPVELGPPAIEVPVPEMSVSEMNRKRRDLEKRVEELTEIFHQMASRKSVIADAINDLKTRLAFTLGKEGSYTDSGFFGIEGWVPAVRAASVKKCLKSGDKPVYISFRDPRDDEEPPVLTEEPAWARPSRALFNVLGVIPGYREYDISPVFIIAMALFTAMLIGDAGYGLLLFIPLAVFYKKLRYGKKVDPNMLHLGLILSGSIAIYGCITGVYFGWSPPADASHGFAGFLRSLRLLDGNNNALMQKLCFIIGTVHLTAAHLWRAARKFSQPVPIRGLADIGWIAALWASYMLVMTLVLSRPLNPAFWPLVFFALTMIILFTEPQKNILKMVLLGIASIPLNALSCFSDIISYVRLMAVGSAGVVMEVAFNNLAIQLHNPIFT
ncbi:MAG: hypothetical protein J7M12_03330, partial [Candidatus Hydrogenedentes bacterium]|nr:hypothetical protein [Candidatus Hydrogenedentota bacterium]